MMVKPMKNGMLAMFLIGLLTVPSSLALAQAADHSLEQVLVESAQTAAEHTALAHHFRAKAAEARAEATSHERMAHSYSQRKGLDQMQFQRHCKDLARSLNQQADSYDALARLHEEAATKAK